MVVHPEAGKWLIAPGRGGLRDDPVRLAGRLRRRRHADGDGDDPAGPPAHRLHAARLRRGLLLCFDGLRVRAVPAGPARHLPGVLPALRRRLPGRRPGLGTAAARPARARRLPRDGLGLGPGPRAALAALAARRRRVLRAGLRHEVERGLPAGGLRDPGVAVGRRRPPGDRGAAAAAALAGRRRAAGLRLPRPGRPRRVRRELDRLAAARRRLREGALGHAVRPLLGQLPASTTRTASSPSCGSRCGRCGTTTTTSTPSTPSSSTAPSTPTSPRRRAG